MQELLRQLQYLPYEDYYVSGIRMCAAYRGGKIHATIARLRRGLPAVCMVGLHNHI